MIRFLKPGGSLRLALLGSACFALVLAACARSGAGLSVGDAAPDFTLPTADGGAVSLADYRGVRPALLYFHMAVG